MKKTTLLFAAFLLAMCSYASETQLIIAKANKAYSDGLYNNAVDLYKQVASSRYES